MHIDFALPYVDTNDTEVKQVVSDVLSYQSTVGSITASHYYLKTIKNIIITKNSGVGLSCLIDYPIGVSDTKSRLISIEQAHKAGANMVDITMPQNLASNRKYDKIREDTKILSEYCLELSMIPRYVLEYRIFDHHCLKKMCEILDGFNIRHVFPSTAYFVDNLSDNLIASVFLYENSKDINIYATGNAWTDKHFSIIEKTGLFGMRITSLPALRGLLEILRKKQNRLS